MWIMESNQDWKYPITYSDETQAAGNIHDNGMCANTVLPFLIMISDIEQNCHNRCRKFHDATMKTKLIEAK